MANRKFKEVVSPKPGQVVAESNDLVVSVFSSSVLGTTYTFAFKSRQPNDMISLSDFEAMINELGLDVRVRVTSTGGGMLAPVAPDVPNVESMSPNQLRDFVMAAQARAVELGILEPVDGLKNTGEPE